MPLLVIGYLLTIDVIGLVKEIGGQNTKTPAPFADTPFPFPFSPSVKSPRKISSAGFQCHAIQNRSNKNQNRSIDKVQNLGNERRYIYKAARQDSGQRNISRSRYPKKCFTQIIGICMETPCWFPPGWAQHGGRETNRNISCRVLVQKREFIPRGTP